MSNVLLGRGIGETGGRGGGEAEETCPSFDGIRQRLFIQLHSVICEANPLPSLQSAFPGLINFSGIYNEKADVKRNARRRKKRNH